MPITFLDEEEDIAPLATPAKRKITFLDEEEDITPLAPPTKRKITFLDEEDDIAPVTPQATQPAVTQPSPYKYDPSRFRPKGVSAPKAEQEIGTLEGIANAARNAFDSSRQALDIVGDVTPEEAKNIAKIEFDKQSRKIAPGYDEYQKAEGFDAVLAFAKNPIEVTSNIVAEGLAGSLPALGAGLAAGGVGAAIGAPTVIGAPIGFTAGQVAGTFAGSLATEYGSKILEEMQEGGVDLTKPESIQGFFENEEAVAKARDKAISRGIPVAAFDAISAGIGGKLGRVIGKQFLTKTGEAAAELGVQAGLGGGGEVAGALVAGEPIEGKAVFGEVIGEAGPGAAEIITGRMADRAARVKAEEEKKIKAAAQLSENLEQNSAPLTAAAVMSTTATTIEQDKLAAQLEEQLDADEIAAQVSEQVTPPITEAIAEAASGVTATKPKVQVTNIDSIINQGGGTVAVQEDGRDVNFKQFGITIDGDTAEVAFVEIDPSEYGKGIGLEAYRSLGNELLSRGITLRSSGAQYGAGRNLWLKLAQKGNARSIGQGRFEFVAQPAAPLTEAVTPTAPVKPSAKPKAKIPPPPPAIITDSTTSEQISSEISTRRSALNAYDFGTEANNKIEAEINKLEAELQSRNEAVTPTITPAVTPAVPTAQPPITDATQEIIQPEGVRQEPQDRVEVRPTEEAGAGDSLLGAERGQEEGQVVPAAPAIPEAITRAIEERRPISAPFVLQYGVDLPRGWRYEDDFFVPPAAPVTPAPVEPAAIVEQEPVAPVTTPPVTEAVTPAAEQPAVSIPASGKPFEFFSIRNKEKAPRLGTQFGQDVEPSGKYISQSTPDAAKNLDARFEKKTVRFENPLVVEFGGEYGTATNWKNVLSSQYGGKTGKQLSQAIRDAGYDGIVTVEPAKGPNRPAYTSEIVDIRSLKPKKQAATPTPAAPEAPVAEPAGISVGSRIKLGKSPQTYTIEEVIPQSATERELGEQYYSVKNERTGETQVVEARDLRQVKGKGARKLFAGERAEIPQFMRDSLNTARAMAAAGKTTEEIRAVTGWFPGRYDGKMRWEIPDNKARFIEREFKTPAPKIIKGTFGKNLNFTQNDDGLYYAEINGKPDWTTGAETREGAENLYYEFNPRKIKYGFGVSGKLFDVIDHGNLFKAYPSAREIAIQFALLPPEKLGAYVRGENKIVISSSLNKNEALSTILHEIQHWVQEQEGFVKGGSPDLFSDSSSYDDFYKNWQNIQDSLTDAYILRGYMDRLGISVADAKSEYRKEFEKEHHPEAGGLAKTLTKEQILEEVNQHGKRLDRARQAAKAGSSFEAYRKVAGEIEARDVQARLELTDEQRSATEPYSSENIALEDAIVIQESEGAASEVSPTPENILITPPDQQYTFNEVFDVAYDMFGGEIPEGFTIVNDSKDKDFEFKAAYIPESGEIIVNLAYLNKSDDIRDTITHELGHYIFGDPEFRAAFDQFIASLSPEARADLDAYVETAYNKYTGEIRLEEKMVRAFVDQFINEEQAPAWRSMLDAIKRFLNKLGFKFNISDRDAISVFTAALDRYKAGEAISREGGARKIIDDLTAMDAEYLAAVERGDMETAQRMVNDAARTAGYIEGPAYHGSPVKGISVFNIPEQIGKYGKGLGVWFAAPSKSGMSYDEGNAEYIADYFAGREMSTDTDGEVYTAFLSVKNPLEFQDFYEFAEFQAEQKQKGLSATQVRENLKADGYDGIVIRDSDTDGNVFRDDWVAFDSSQIKRTDPVTYDDAGDVIPLSQRFRPTSPDIRRMAAEPALKRRKEQVGGAEREETRYITTPKGILSMNTDVLREKFFDGTSVSPEKTTQAWGYISRLLDIRSGNANKFAGEINNTVIAELEARRDAAIAAGEKVDPEEDVSKRIGAAMFSVELMNYAGKLAEQGDQRMLKFMIRNVNSMPVDEYAGNISDAARALRTRLEYEVSGFGAYSADQKGKVERTAAVMFGTNKPNEEQVKTVKDALDKSEKTELGNPEEVAGDIENVEKRTGRRVVKKIEEKIKASTAPKKEELLISFQNLNQDRKFAGINIVYKPQKIDPAKNIQNLIIGKLVDYRKTLIKQGADGLESTFWQTMSNKERKPGPLGEIDQAQNNELANIVQKTLIDLGMKGEPPNTKMTDIEKVASILNKQLLGEEKKIAADKRVVEEIERRRSTELEGASDADAVNAKYDAILNAWNEAMSRQTNMPISDNMLQRLINSELKEQGSNVTELINEPYEDVLSQKKKDIVDSIIRRVYGVSKEAETGIEINEDYDNLSRYLKQTLENMLRMQAEKRDAAVARTLQRGLGDLPALPEVQKNKAQTIVQQDLRQQPDMGRREPWQNMLVGKLTQAGVAPEQAENIANLVWRQHEINDANRKIKEMKTAAEKGSLAVIIDRIKNTSLEKQQSPEWKQEVIKEYLRDAGLSSQAAETAAKLYDSIISERLAAAKQKAFEDTLAKAAPWKDYASRNSKLAKDALRKVQDAIRTGVLDPDQTTESIIAAQNGWTGFTKEQYQRIVEIDTILNDPKQDDVTKKEALAELNKIITAAKLPAKFKEAIADYYVGQALLGIPTFSVNMASPAGFSIRNILTDIAKYAFTDPKRIPIAFESLLDSMRSWYGNVSYSFRTEIYPNDVVEYLQGGDALKEIFNRGKKQWAEGKYAEGFTNMAVGMAHITKKVLSALDQGAISMIENQNLTRYAMEALSAQKKIPKDQIRAFGQSILAIRNQSIAQSVSEGMPRDRAIVLADLAAKSELIYSLSRYDISPDDVLNSAINDALQSVGRNRKITIKGIEESDKDISDTGTLTYLPIRFLEMIAEKSMQSGPAMQVFSKMVYGFALIPARVFSNVAWFSPVGAYRFAVDAFANKMGWKSPYAMSLGTGLQYRQRLTETIAGSIAMLGLVALRSDSTEDDEDKKFKIVITGNGPNAVTDKQYYDSWMKKWKPYSIHIVVNGTIIPINIGRGGEALFFPIMLAGALDDLAIKKKQNLTKKEPEDLVSAVEVLGSSFFALAQRGPYAAFTKPLFDASKQGRVTEELASQAGYFGKTFIPVLGTSLARNITDFINDPVDRSSIEGAIYANTPVVGPWLGTKALNALGQPIRADDWGDKLFKLGVPVVFSFPKNTPENALNELILKQGGGPTIPTRSNAQKRFGDILTDKEFETYVREYGRVMSDKMFKSRTKLANMKPADYDDELEKYARGYSIDGIKIKGASDSAVLAVKRMRQ